MLCPNCKDDEEIEIYATTSAYIQVTREGDHIGDEDWNGWEWNKKSGARCTKCDWEGKVKDLMKADPEHEESEVES